MNVLCRMRVRRHTTKWWSADALELLDKYIETLCRNDTFIHDEKAPRLTRHKRNAWLDASVMLLIRSAERIRNMRGKVTVQRRDIRTAMEIVYDTLRPTITCAFCQDGDDA
jgi:histone H3/H4